MGTLVQTWVNLVMDGQLPEEAWRRGKSDSPSHLEKAALMLYPPMMRMVVWSTM